MGLDHRKLQEEAARLIPQSILYESKNPLKRYIQNKRRETVLHFTKGKRMILDVGCGDGFFLEKADNAIGIDLSLVRARRAKERSRKPVIVSTAEKLPFKAQSFECVIISEVLEHLVNPIECLTEVTRVMERGGSVVISIPNDRMLRIGGKFAHALGVVVGGVSSNMKYEIPDIQEHIHEISPQYLRKNFELENRSNVLFNLPFELAFFHIGLYRNLLNKKEQ